MITYKWIGVESWIKPVLIAGRYKKDVKLNPLESHIKISFRFEDLICKLDVEGKLITKTGSIEVVKMRLNTGESIIGLYDLTTADRTEYEMAWRGVLKDRLSNAIKKGSLGRWWHH